MGKFRSRLSFALAGGTACVISFTPAAGQQTTAPQTNTQQTSVPQTATQSGSTQQTATPQTNTQQISVPQTTTQSGSTQQTAAQQTATPQIATQQAPSQQLIRQRAQQNPARRIGLPPTGQQPGTGEGLSVTLDYLSSLRYDDNLRLTDPSLGSTTWWENSLGIGIVNQTSDSTFSFDLSGLYRIANEPIIGSDSEFVDPFTRLSYLRNRANSQFGALVEYRERDLAFNRSITDVNLDGNIDSADVLGTIGDQVDTRGNLDWQVGLNDPVGVRFTYDHFERTYQGTIDPNLFDNRTDFYTLTTFLRFNPVLQGNVRLAYNDFRADDVPRTDTKTTTLTVGATYEVSSVTTIDANIGVSQVDDTLRAFNTNTVDEDYVASFAWSRELPDGTADVLLDHSFGVNGARTNATVGRSFQRPNGSLDFNVGLTRGPFGEVTPIGEINYLHQLNNSQVAVAIQRRVGTSTQSEETRQTVAFLTYDYFINPVSALSFNFNFIDQENEGPAVADPRQRASFTAAYTRAITNDWAISFGYQYERDEQNTFEGTSNSVYFTLGRQFFLKP